MRSLAKPMLVWTVPLPNLLLFILGMIGLYQHTRSWVALLWALIAAMEINWPATVVVKGKDQSEGHVQ